MPIEFLHEELPEKEILVRHISSTRNLQISPSEIEAFVDWRYYGRKNSVPVMAISNGECLAFVDSQMRSYALSGETVVFQESSEWYCQPKYRPIGLGVSVMKKMMERDEPIISIRGTDASQKLVAKLGWEKLQPVVLFSKMINWRTRTKDCFKKLGKMGKKSKLVLTISKEHPEADLLNKQVGEVGCLATSMEPWEVEWFNAAPDVLGSFRWLTFFRNDDFLAYALIRIYEGAEYRRGQIIHFQSTSHELHDLTELLAIVSDYMAEKGVIRLLARFSWSTICRACELIGFQNLGPQPVFVWDKRSVSWEGSQANLTYLRGDDSIRPFSEIRVNA